MNPVTATLQPLAASVFGGPWGLAEALANCTTPAHGDDIAEIFRIVIPLQHHLDTLGIRVSPYFGRVDSPRMTTLDIAATLSKVPHEAYHRALTTLPSSVARHVSTPGLFDPRWMGRHLWNTNTTSPSQTAFLNQILGSIERDKGHLMILDLDDTLYAARCRQAMIWREYGRVYGVPALQQAEPEHIVSWQLQPVLVDQMGADPDWVEAEQEELKRFWTDRFFTSAYTLFDQPLPGAADFVNAAFERGAIIVYLTGRDERHMRQGTLAALRRDGFPIGMKGTTLFCNPESPLEIFRNFAEAEAIARVRTSDAQFKEAAFAKIAKMGKPLASFDNEPRNANILHRLFHENFGFAVRLNTASAPKPEPLDRNVISIDGFLR